MPLARALLAALLAFAAGGAAQAQVNVQVGPTTGGANPLIGRWSESSACTGSATQFVFTTNRFEIIGRDGRWYLANVAYVRQGADPAIRVTAAPTFSRLGPAAPGAGDTYVFRNDPVNRITPVAILRASGRRDQVGNDTPIFTRCR